MGTQFDGSGYFQIIAGAFKLPVGNEIELQFKNRRLLRFATGETHRSFKGNPESIAETQELRGDALSRKARMHSRDRVRKAASHCSVDLSRDSGWHTWLSHQDVDNALNCRLRFRRYAFDFKGRCRCTCRGRSPFT